MFESLQTAPPDAILGLNEAFRSDEHPEKINLTVGVYQDDEGRTPILRCVKEAERRLLETEASKSYLGIDGLPDFARHVPALLFDGHPVREERRVATLQTPGGTGALRVAADFLARNYPGSRVWCSRPTWANHKGVFAAAGLGIAEYAYLDAAGTGLDRHAFLEDLRKVPQGDVVCLHGCCHNPTGVDPAADDWHEVASILQDRGALPLIDLAYQGFGTGLREDARPLEVLLEAGLDLIICSSFSKNFGLYSERVGALTLVAASPEAAAAALSQGKTAVRTNYSNPPRHGAAIVATVLDDDALRSDWEDELANMRDRIHRLRHRFVEVLKECGVERDFSFLTQQSGMFSFSGLTPEQVDRLREEYSIYIVRSGRINVAGLNEANLPRCAAAIASVCS